jgi:membrane associated rhomboid family serine protease
MSPAVSSRHKQTLAKLTRGRLPQATDAKQSIEGLILLAGIVALMWLLEVINTLDSNGLNGAGIHPRNLSDLWDIFTAPFLHVSFQHLTDNTIPFVFMGVIIALRGAVRLALVTLIVIVIGGLGTWLISPAHSATGQPIVTVGASGVVFGYATYLFTRGVFNRSVLEILTAVVVAVVWGGALLYSIVPHPGVSWQGHASGAVGGVVAAWLLARNRAERGTTSRGDPLARALAQ